MTETGDEFAGTSERSTKHSPRVDEELEHEIQGMVRSGHSDPRRGVAGPRAGRGGEPDIDADPSGTLVGGTPAGMDADAVNARTELARWLDRADFPSTGADLVEAARDHRAPDAIVAELERLPGGGTFDRVGDVVRALGFPTE